MLHRPIHRRQIDSPSFAYHMYTVEKSAANDTQCNFEGTEGKDLIAHTLPLHRPTGPLIAGKLTPNPFCALLQCKATKKYSKCNFEALKERIYSSLANGPPPHLCYFTSRQCSGGKKKRYRNFEREDLMTQAVLRQPTHCLIISLPPV